MPRLHRIAPHATDYLTGISTDGRRVLMGALAPDFIVVLFDASGRFLQLREERLQADTAAKAGERFAREFGLAEAPIDILPFQIAAGDVGVAALPEYFAEFLRDPEGTEPLGEIRRRMHDEVEQWLRAERCVLRWGKEYWLNADGSVYAT